VVAVVELLARQSTPSSVASIASRLELNRSTVTAILLALERAGWASRQSDRRYTLGTGLIGVAEAVRSSLPLADRFADALDELAQHAGCGASLAMVVRPR
jgi:DNA-binding IclR family transcriptional regulator